MSIVFTQDRRRRLQGYRQGVRRNDAETAILEEAHDSAASGVQDPSQPPPVEMESVGGSGFLEVPLNN